MEPDFIREQVHNVWRVIATNSKLITDRGLKIEGAFVDPDFVLGQAAALHNAVIDSVNILKAGKNSARQFAIMKPDFLGQQVNALQIVTRDNARLLDPTKTIHSELASLGDEFVLNLATNLRNVISDNARVALESVMEPNALFMSRPDFIERLVAAYHCVLAAYARQKGSVAVLHERGLATEAALRELQTQLDAAIAAKFEALSKVAPLEASVATLQTECDKANADAKEAADSAQGRILKLEGELALVTSDHLSCGSMNQEQVAELATLKEEHKALIKRCEEQHDAAAMAVSRVVSLNEEKRQLQLDHDKLAAQLADVQAASVTFSLTRAEEHDKMNLEIARLEDLLKKREVAMNALDGEKAQLRAALDSVKADLSATNTQLAATVIQCDTWKATLDDVISRQTTDMDAIREAAAKEKETSDDLLGNAVKKIEDLEIRLRQKDDEISALHEAAKRQAQRPVYAPPVKLPASPPPSSRKRALPEENDQKRVTTAGSSSGGGWAPDLAAHGSPLPIDRVNELASLPVVTVDLGHGQDVPAIFSRQSLSHILGGSIQGLIVRCTNSATVLARQHDIRDYLCPNMDHNAWSPAGPGKHGYMQVGLGRDSKLFNDAGEYRHVFVGAGKHLLYCGWYHVLRVEPLTKEEWATLPDKVKRTYSETTVNKEKSSALRNADGVQAMYDAGELRAPCVRLQCLKFDTAFYHELVQANDRFFGNKPRPTGPSGKAGPSKRRRLAKEDTEAKDDDSEEEVSLALATKRTATLATPAGTPAPSAATQRQGEDKTAGTAANPLVVDAPGASSSNDAAPVAGPSTSTARSPPRTRWQSGSLILHIPPNDRPSHSSANDDSDLSPISNDDDMYLG